MEATLPTEPTAAQIEAVPANGASAKAGTSGPTPAEEPALPASPTNQHPVGWYLWVGLLAALVFVRGLLWLEVVPPWQGPDEPGHFEYIGLIDRLGRTPSLRPNVENDPALTIAINDSAFEQRFEQFHPGTNIRQNSAQDPPLMTGPREAGYQRPTFYLMALPIYQALNGQSILTQYYAVALLPISLGVLTVLAAAGAVRATLPGNRWALAVVPLLVAFWPTQSHMLTRINNDNLATASAALAFWMGALVLRDGLRILPSLGLVGALALAAYAKGTSLFVLGFGLPVFAYGGLRLLPRRGPRALDVMLIGLGVVGVAAVVLAWNVPAVAEWLMRLVDRLPGGNRVQGFLSSALHALVLELHMEQTHLPAQALHTLRSFWAVFGWGSFFLPGYFYHVAAGAALVAIAGWGWLVWGARRASLAWSEWQWRTLALLAAGIPMGLLPLAARMIYDPYDIAFHGRVIQTLLIPVATLLVVGWQQWLPQRWQGTAAVGLALVLLWLDAVIFTQVLLPRFYS